MKDLEGRFAEVEKRVRTIAGENAGLKQRISELERELARTRQEAQELDNFKGERLLLREKIERILHALETAGEKE